MLNGPTTSRGPVLARPVAGSWLDPNSRCLVDDRRYARFILTLPHTDSCDSALASPEPKELCVTWAWQDYSGDGIYAHGRIQCVSPTLSVRNGTRSVRNEHLPFESIATGSPACTMDFRSSPLPTDSPARYESMGFCADLDPTAWRCRAGFSSTSSILPGMIARCTFTHSRQAAGPSIVDFVVELAGGRHDRITRDSHPNQPIAAHTNVCLGIRPHVRSRCRTSLGRPPAHSIPRRRSAGFDCCELR